MAAPHEFPGGGSSAALAEWPPAPKKAPWSNAEDAVLLEQVRQQGGPRNWEGISAALPGRNARSCRLRWLNHLAHAGAAYAAADTGGNAPPFTAEEDAVVVACHRVFPGKWAAIARFLPGRTDIDVRNRCYTALRDVLAAPEPLRRRHDGTLPLFPLVPGDVRTSGGGDAVLRRPQPVIGTGDHDDQTQSGACLELFPMAPGDLANGRNNLNAREEAAMEVDGGMHEMRLWPASTAMAAFRAMVQAVRAP
ncbi:unnamed protein product [Urochloa decumbens]|uniref:Uncharacterized protein n=1 Tax=Urochloa decumbens TaxID=240449 RepID=A0ABC9GNJ6_9POAL